MAVGSRGFQDHGCLGGIGCLVRPARHPWASRGSWLCPCLQPAAVGNVPRFLQYLTTQLHRQVPGGLVVWYDSVVTSGQLKWQDELNENNR